LEINFSLSTGAGRSLRVARGVSGAADLLISPRKGARSLSSSGTGECGSMAARACRGVVPAGLERGLEVVAHPRRGVGVEAAHAGHLVAEALLGE
jgi:hypothetical protein